MDDSRSSSFAGQGDYEIRAKGHLDEQWSPWFEDLTITTGFDENGTPVTTFTGPIVDQAALHGVLGKIRDINMPLISVNQVVHGSAASEENKVGDLNKQDNGMASEGSESAGGGSSGEYQD
jgi:hypothetical protein